jgi:hypothetical protein
LFLSDTQKTKKAVPVNLYKYSNHCNAAYDSLNDQTAATGIQVGKNKGWKKNNPKMTAIKISIFIR